MGTEEILMDVPLHARENKLVSIVIKVLHKMDRYVIHVDKIVNFAQAPAIHNANNA